MLAKPGKSLSDITVFKRDLIDDAFELVGTVSSSDYHQDSAYIIYKGLKVFFNPKMQTDFNESMRGKAVLFKMGYSFKGAIALNNTIKEPNIESTENTYSTKSIHVGERLRCRYKKTVKGGINIINLIDFQNEEGVVYTSDMPKGHQFPKDNNPFVMTVKQNNKVSLKLEGKIKKYWKMQLK